MSKRKEIEDFIEGLGAESYTKDEMKEVVGSIIDMIETGTENMKESHAKAIEAMAAGTMEKITAAQKDAAEKVRQSREVLLDQINRKLTNMAAEYSAKCEHQTALAVILARDAILRIAP